MADLTMNAAGQGGSPFFKDKTVQDLDKLLAQSKALKARFEPIWYLNQMFYIGDQWVFWNRGRLDRPRLDPWRVTLSDNRVLPAAQKQLARLTKQKPSFQVVPTTDEDADLQASAMGEKVLDYLWHHLKLGKRLSSVLLWAQITGAGFWKISWDNAKGKKATVVVNHEGSPMMNNETGMPFKPEHFEGAEGNQLPEGFGAKTVATGDVHVEVVSPFEIYNDPIAKELEDCEWLIQTTVHSPEYVKQRFGVNVDPDTDVAPGPAEARLFPSWQMGGTTGYRGVLLKEYWCKPNDQHPQGRYAVWCKGGKGGQILAEGPNPYECLPYVMFKGYPMPGRFWPTSLLEQLKSPQTELNKLKSQIVENYQRLGNPALLCSKQANIQYSGTPGERIDFDDTTQNAIPSYLQAPPMPQYIIQQIDRHEKSIEEISGQHEVTNAQVPAGVKAASAINLLQEADDTRLGPTVYEMEESLGYAGEQLLKLVAQYWTQERTVQVSGADSNWEFLSFQGAALKENTHVEVQAGSAFPRTKAAKQAAIESILQLAFQYEGQQAMNPRMLSKLLKDYETGGLEKLFGDFNQTEEQINRENNELMQGAELPINAYDEDQMHIEGHEENQRTNAYHYAPEPVKLMTERHIAMHRMRIVEKAQLQEQQQMQQQEVQAQQQMGHQEQEHEAQLEHQGHQEVQSAQIEKKYPPPQPQNGRPAASKAGRS